MFADDTKLSRRIQDMSSCEALQADLDKVQEWSKTWLLKFHPVKCKVLSIGKSRNDIVRHYKMEGDHGDVQLDNVEFEKDIGVTIDNKLSFEQHISEKVNSANSLMGVIRRTYEHLDEENFCLLFKAFVRPHIEYANSVWAPYKIKHIETIENVQRRATKQIPSLRHLSYEERLRKLNLPSLVYRRLRGDMIELYKIMSGVYDTSVSTFLTEQVNSITRGHSKKLFLQFARLNVRKNWFGKRNVIIWNNLPELVVNSPSVKVFEKRLDCQTLER